MSVDPGDSELSRRQFGVLLASAVAVPAVLGQHGEPRGGPPTGRTAGSTGWPSTPPRDRG